MTTGVWNVKSRSFEWEGQISVTQVCKGRSQPKHTESHDSQQLSSFLDLTSTLLLTNTPSQVWVLRFWGQWGLQDLLDQIFCRMGFRITTLLTPVPVVLARGYRHHNTYYFLLFEVGFLLFLARFRVKFGSSFKVLLKIGLYCVSITPFPLTFNGFTSSRAELRQIQNNSNRVS